VSGGEIEVSVVLPTRDRWALADDALSSALDQRGVSVEVCVVDDGSLRPAPPGFGDDPRVRLFRHDRPRGVASSRNRAILAARGKWVAFLDDDDVWAPWHLQRLLRPLAENGARWGYSGYVMTTLQRKPIGNGPIPAVESDLARQFLSTNPVGTPSCACVETETVRSIGGFNEQMSVMADWDLWVRLAEAARPVTSPAFTVGYAQHDRSMSLDTDRAQAEWAYMAARYKSELERLDLTFADNAYFWRWMAQGYARRRRRRSAARLFLRAAVRGGEFRDVVRAIAVIPVIGWPIRLRRWIMTVLRRRQKPASVHAWLQPFSDRASSEGSGSLPSASGISQRCRVRTRPSP
jgi:glycosyltransferase involved in cell wall biosynthesis